MTEAFVHFQRVDPIMARAMERIGGLSETSQKMTDLNLFSSLCESIVSQQLSTKVADVIWGRVQRVFPDQKIHPEEILKIDTEHLRAQGISYAKIRALKDLSEKVTSNVVDLQSLQALSDEEVISMLTQVRGIGRWTAEMFLMFSLERPDVFSHGDLGLKRAIQRLYALDHEPTAMELENLSSRWSPYRTFASRVLWKTLDSKE